MRRIVAAAAFVTMARTETGLKTSKALDQIAKDGSPMARGIAKLTAGLIAGKADGMTFLQELVP
jgi:hypothetical protein